MVLADGPGCDGRESMMCDDAGKWEKRSWDQKAGVRPGMLGRGGKV